jgi:hypothetical protein
MCNGKNTDTTVVYAFSFIKAISKTTVETQDTTLRSKQAGPHCICSEQSAMQHIVTVHNSTEKSLNFNSTNGCTVHAHSQVQLS